VLSAGGLAQRLTTEMSNRHFSWPIGSRPRDIRLRRKLRSTLAYRLGLLLPSPLLCLCLPSQVLRLVRLAAETWFEGATATRPGRSSEFLGFGTIAGLVSPAAIGTSGSLPRPSLGHEVYINRGKEAQE